jgi:hypothetical protein
LPTQRKVARQRRRRCRTLLIQPLPVLQNAGNANPLPPSTFADSAPSPTPGKGNCSPAAHDAH